MEETLFLLLFLFFCIFWAEKYGVYHYSFILGLHNIKDKTVANICVY